MKKILRFIGSQKLKVRNFIYFLLLILFFLVLVLIQSYKSSEVNYLNVFENSQNILSKTAMVANTKYGDNLYFRPNEYIVKNEKNHIMLEHRDSIFTIYFGKNSSISEEYLASINPHQDILFSRQMKEEGTDNIKYFYIWDYTYKDFDEYVQVMIGENDRNIVGIVPLDEVEKYTNEMSYIYNSIKVLEEK